MNLRGYELPEALLVEPRSWDVRGGTRGSVQNP